MKWKRFWIRWGKNKPAHRFFPEPSLKTDPAAGGRIRFEERLLFFCKDRKNVSIIFFPADEPFFCRQRAAAAGYFRSKISLSILTISSGLYGF
jgi:hypothetical protein